MPGGFGTLDELFESLTLIQTGRTPPIPLVLLAPPGDDFWSSWREELHERLCSRELISPEDPSLLMETTTASEAVERICRFFRVFHSAHLGEDLIELLLNAPIPAEAIEELNRNSPICRRRAPFRPARAATTVVTCGPVCVCVSTSAAWAGFIS